MSDDFDLFGREILAFLALHPDGVAVQEVKKHTERRVRARKTFDAKFAKSLAMVLDKGPFQTHSLEGAAIIAPTASRDRGLVAPPLAGLGAQVKQAIIACLVPVGSVGQVAALSGCVRQRLSQAGIDLGDMFAETFGGYLDLLSQDPDPMIRFGDGTDTYQRLR